MFSDDGSDSLNVSSSTMLDEIKALGCQSSMKMMLAYQTYVELTRIEKLTKITCKYSAPLDLIYIVGNKDGSPVTYVPVFSSFEISPLWIQSVQNEISSSNPRSIVLVIRDADSNFVSYVLTQDLVLPSEDSNRQAKANTAQSSSQSKKRKRSGSMDLDFAA